MSQTRTIALALELGHLWEWHQAVYAGTQQYAEQCGNWRCVIDEYPLRVNRTKIASRQYEGVIARVKPSLAAAARRQKVPLVNVWFQSAASCQTSVFYDPRAAGRLAAAHLIQRGFRSFGCLAKDETRAEREYLRGFGGAVADAGLGELAFSTTLPRNDDFDSREWQALLTKIGDCLARVSPPAGLFVTRGYHARQVVHLCQDRGWNVPRDVALVCAENEQAMCENPPPSLTAVDMNWQQVGFQAARLLNQLMDGAPPPRTPILVPPRGIVQRASTDFFAVEDELVAAALRFISANLGRPLSTDDVARAVAASRRTLQRKFQEKLKRPPGAEIRRLRIELAKRLLADPHRQIADVARRAGLGSTHHLGEIFRREVGCSPREYRKQLLGERDNSR